jgi:hypothetical protein
MLSLVACNTTAPGSDGAAGASGNGASGATVTGGGGGFAGRASGGTSASAGTGASSRGGGTGSFAGASGTSASSGGAEASAGATGGGGTGEGFAGHTPNGGASAGLGVSGDDQSDDGGAAGAGCDDGITVANASCLPKEEPSTQTVYFDVTNSTTGDVYLVTSGKDCTAYGLRASSASSDLILEPFDPVDCPCGLACDSNTQSLIQKLAAGETLTLAWDARDVIIRHLKVPNECDSTQTVTETITVPHRVSPGQYNVSIGYYLPPPCEYCGMQPTYAFSFQPQCSADEHVSASFTLPDAGDVRVPVALEDR